MNYKILTIAGLSVILLFGSFLIMKISYGNKDAEIRNMISAKQKDNENVYDSVWKIINQQAQVSNEYKNAFKEIYPELIAGRYSSGGEMMKWIQESNPNFDISLYKQLMVSIEAQRMRFSENQTRLLDYKREHDNLITKVPSKWFISNIPVEVMIVTSTKTTEVFTSGTDDDVKLFN
jgi:hypothetical protein